MATRWTGRRQKLRRVVSTTDFITHQSDLAGLDRCTGKLRWGKPLDGVTYRFSSALKPQIFQRLVATAAWVANIKLGRQLKIKS